MTDHRPTGNPARLSAISTTLDAIHVVTLAGELDRDTVETACQALPAADAPHPHLVIDLERVTFCDSTGINLFITTHHALGQLGGWLRLAAPAPTIRRTLQIVGVDTIIDCYPTLDQALQT